MSPFIRLSCTWVPWPESWRPNYLSPWCIRRWGIIFTILHSSILGVFIPCWCCWYFQPEPEPERKNSLSEKKSSSPNHNGEAADAESGHVPSELTLGSWHVLTHFAQLVDTPLFSWHQPDPAGHWRHGLQHQHLRRQWRRSHIWGRIWMEMENESNWYLVSESKAID